jgi:large subunit ribosomal protein L24
MPRVHVRKGDTVLVVTGKDKGKKGKVISVDPEKSRVIIDGINIVKRHTKPTQKMPQGGIIEKPAPVHSSNVMLFCTKCNSATRIRKKVLDDEGKVRVCRECGEIIV